MIRKLFSSILVIVLTLSLFTGVAYGGADPIVKFVEELFYMDNNEMFMDMVDTFHALSDNARDDFKDIYLTIVEALDTMHEAEISDTEKEIYDLVVQFVSDPTVTSTTLSNMRSYLGDNNSSSFADAFYARGIQFGSVGIDEDLISRGVTRLDRVFEGLKLTSELKIRIIRRNTSTNRYSDNGTIDSLLNAYFIIGGNDSPEARTKAKDAFNDLIDFYNNDLSASDKTVVNNYFSGKLGIVSNFTPDTGTTPVTPPPATVVDEFDEAIDEEDIDEAEEILGERATNAQSEEDAEKVLGNANKYLETVTKTISTNVGEAEVQVQKIAQTVNTASNTIALITDPAKAQEKATELIKQIASTTKAAKEVGAEVIELERVAEELAAKVVEKAGATKVTATVLERKATANLTTTSITDQVTKAKAAAEAMAKELVDNDIATTKARVETKVSINVEAEDVDEVEVSLPNLKEVFEQVDKVKVSSSVASFELTKDTIETEDSEDYEEKISLSAKRSSPDEVEALRATLAAGESIPEGAEVINLTASVARVNKSTGETESTRSVTTFNQRIKVAVSYTLKEGDNPREISVFLVKDDGTIEKVGGVYNSVTKQVEFFRSTFSNYFAAALRVAFTDTVELDALYKDAIEILAGKGMIAGKTAQLYDPEALVTRAEFAVLIARILQLEADPADMPFTDVDNSNAWYRNHLAGAYKAGIINGRSTTVFDPNSDINRQEAAAIVVNAARYLGYKDADGSLIATRYEDHGAIAPWAVKSVATVHRDRLARGMYDVSYQPLVKVTRAETAVFIYNMLFRYN